MTSLCQKPNPTATARLKATGRSMFVSLYVLEEGHDAVNTPSNWGMEASG